MNRQRRIWTDLHHIDGSILIDGNGCFKTSRLMEQLFIGMEIGFSMEFERFLYFSKEKNRI